MSPLRISDQPSPADLVVFQLFPAHHDHPQAIGDDLDPLPWRNGLGTSVLGPWNRERSRQSPDLVRPPTTDHGNMPNLRWSFADSHIRIEVSIRTTGVEWVTSAQNTNNRKGGWVDPTDHTAGARR